PDEADVHTVAAGPDALDAERALGVGDRAGGERGVLRRDAPDGDARGRDGRLRLGVEDGAGNGGGGAGLGRSRPREEDGENGEEGGTEDGHGGVWEVGTPAAAVSGAGVGTGGRVSAWACDRAWRRAPSSRGASASTARDGP